MDMPIPITPAIRIEGIDFAYGHGQARNNVLFNV
jgi:hypothetical protein